MCNKDIYVKLFSDNSWELYNQGSLEICSNSHADYLKTLLKVYKAPEERSDLLIVGGGDYQIATDVGHLLKPKSTMTVIDPYVKDYQRFVCFYAEDIDQIQLQDKINAGNLIVNDIPLKFSEAYQDIDQKRYDTIIVDCSEQIVKETEEIYCEAFIKTCAKLLKPKGNLYFYIPPKVSITPLLEKYFQFVDQSSNYIEAWDEFAYIVKLKLKV